MQAQLLPPPCKPGIDRTGPCCCRRQAYPVGTQKTVIRTALPRAHRLPAGEEASVQERLESVLEGPFNNLASKRPKLSYSASSLAEDKKNFLYTLMGEVSAAGPQSRWQDPAALGKYEVSEQHPGLPPGAGTGAEQVPVHLPGDQQALPATNCSEGFKQAAAAC